MLNGLDLFSGGGGLAEGLHRWARPVAYCEIEPGAQRVLLSRMARGELYAAPIWDDVRTLRGDMLPSLDLIAGGFPCQDISEAGAGAGLDGDRSGLFFEIVRLARECRPQYLFLENVSALAFRGLDRVLLAIDGLGYDARWTTLSAAEVGAPHIRERIWILAHAKDNGDGRWEQFTEGSESPRTLANPACEGLSVVGGGKAGAKFSGIGAIGDPGWWKSEPDVGRVAHGVADRVNRLRILGNGVVPLCATEAFQRLSGLK